MVEVKVKVKVKVSGQKGQKEPAKKTRKTRKDKGVKRVKRTTKNPQFQTGSIDFRTIGTQQNSNATLLAGLIASRAVVPQYLQPQQPQQPKQTTTELSRYAPRDIIKSSVPPPQFRPDSEQAQEEQSAVLKLQRAALTANIRNLRKGKEKVEEEFKSVQQRLYATQLAEEKMREELTANSQKLVEQQDLLSEQRKELFSGINAMQAQGLSKLLREKGVEPNSTKAEELRKQYWGVQGLREDEDYKVELKRGKGGGVNVLVPIEKQDLQRAQEERPPQAAAAELTSLQAVEPIEPPEKTASPRMKMSQALQMAQTLQAQEKIEEEEEEIERLPLPKKIQPKKINELSQKQLLFYQNRYKTTNPDPTRLKMVEDELLRRQEEESSKSEFTAGIELLRGKT